MFSLRIVNVDSYQSAPTKGYDICYSEFRGCEVFKVPIIRIFGITPAGQKGCLHIHGVFPYFSIRFKDVFPNIEAKSIRKCLQELALDIDKALNVASRNSNSHRHHVYRIVITEQIPFYGFHEKAEEFLKIYFYNPFDVSRTAELMTNGVILNKFIQPYEAHIPYILQFFIDYNLFGMNLIKVSKFKFRASENDFVSPTSPLRSQSVSQTVLDETLQSSYKVWNICTMSSSQVSSLPRQSTCELELDCCSSEIMNRLSESFSSGKNPGLLAIWDEERQRRINENEPSQITPIPSQERNEYFETESENFYKKKLRKILESFDLYKVGSKPKSVSCNDDSKNQLPSSNSSDLSNTQDEEMLNMMLSMVNSQSTQLDDDSVLGLNQYNEAQGDNVDEETFEMTQLFTAELEEAWSQVKEEEEDCKDSFSIPNLSSNDGPSPASNKVFIPQLDGAFDQEDQETGKKEFKSNKSSTANKYSSPPVLHDEAALIESCSLKTPIVRLSPSVPHDKAALVESCSLKTPVVQLSPSVLHDEAALIESCSLKIPIVRLSPSVIVKMEESHVEENISDSVSCRFLNEEDVNASNRNPLPLCVPVSKKSRCSLVMNIQEGSNDVNIQHTCDSLFPVETRFVAEDEDPSHVVFEVITNLIYKVECLTESRTSCYEYLTEEFRDESYSKSFFENLSTETRQEISSLKTCNPTIFDNSPVLKKECSNETNYCLPLKKRLYNWDKSDMKQCKTCDHKLLIDFSKIGREIVVLKKLSESDFVKSVKLNELKVVIPPLPSDFLKPSRDFLSNSIPKDNTFRRKINSLISSSSKNLKNKNALNENSEKKLCKNETHLKKEHLNPKVILSSTTSGASNVIDCNTINKTSSSSVKCIGDNSVIARKNASNLSTTSGSRNTIDCDNINKTTTRSIKCLKDNSVVAKKNSSNLFTSSGANNATGCDNINKSNSRSVKCLADNSVVTRKNSSNLSTTADASNAIDFDDINKITSRSIKCHGDNLDMAGKKSNKEQNHSVTGNRKGTQSLVKNNIPVTSKKCVYPNEKLDQNKNSVNKKNITARSCKGTIKEISSKVCKKEECMTSNKKNNDISPDKVGQSISKKLCNIQCNDKITQIQNISEKIIEKLNISQKLVDCKKNSDQKGSLDHQKLNEDVLGMNKNESENASKKNSKTVNKVAVSESNIKIKVEPDTLIKDLNSNPPKNICSSTSDLRFYRRRKFANDSDCTNTTRNSTDVSPVSQCADKADNSAVKYKVVEKDDHSDIEIIPSDLGANVMASTSSAFVPVVRLESCNDLIDKYCNSDNPDSDCLIIGEYSNKSKTNPRKRKHHFLRMSLKKAVNKDTTISAVIDKDVDDKVFLDKKVSVKLEKIPNFSTEHADSVSECNKSKSFDVVNKSKISKSKRREKCKPVIPNKKLVQKFNPDAAGLCVMNSKGTSVFPEKASATSALNNSKRDVICKLSLKLNKKDLCSGNDSFKKEDVSKSDSFYSTSSCSSSFQSTSGKHSGNSKSVNLIASENSGKCFSKRKKLQGDVAKNSALASDLNIDWAIDESTSSQLKDAHDLKCTITKKSDVDGRSTHAYLYNRKPIPKFKMKRKKTVTPLNIRLRPKMENDPDFKPAWTLGKRKSAKKVVRNSDLLISVPNVKEKKKSKRALKYNSLNCHISSPLKKIVTHDSHIQKGEYLNQNTLTKTDISKMVLPKDLENISLDNKILSNVLPLTDDDSNDTKVVKSNSLKLKLKLKRILTRSNEERIIVVEKELEGMNEENGSDEPLIDKQSSCTKRGSMSPHEQNNNKKSLGHKKMKYHPDKFSLKAKFKCPLISGNEKLNKSSKYLKDKKGIEQYKGPKITVKPLLENVSLAILPEKNYQITHHEYHPTSVCPVSSTPSEKKSKQKSHVSSPKKKSPLKNVDCIKNELTELHKMMCTDREVADVKVIPKNSYNIVSSKMHVEPENSHIFHKKSSFTSSKLQCPLTSKDKLQERRQLDDPQFSFQQSVAILENKKFNELDENYIANMSAHRSSLNFEKNACLDVDYDQKFFPTVSAKTLHRRNSLKTQSSKCSEFVNCDSSKIPPRRHSLKIQSSKYFNSDEENFKVSSRNNLKNLSFKKFFESDEDACKISPRRSSLKTQNFKKFFDSDNEESSIECLTDGSEKNIVSNLLSVCQPCTVKLHRLSPTEIDNYIFKPFIKAFPTQKLLSCETSVLSVPSPIVDVKGVDIDPTKMLDNLFNFPLASNSPFKCSKFESSPFRVENDKSSESISFDIMSSRNVPHKAPDKCLKGSTKRPCDVFKSVEREDMGILWDLAYLSPISAHSPTESPPSCFSPTQNVSENFSVKNEECPVLDDLEMSTTKSSKIPFEFHNKMSFSLTKEISYNLMESEDERSMSMLNEDNSSLDFKNNVKVRSKTSFENILQENEQCKDLISAPKSEVTPEPGSSSTSNGCNSSSVNVATPEVKSDDFCNTDSELVFQPSDSLPNVRILDFQECLIESDSEMNPLLNDSDIDAVMSQPDFSICNSDIMFDPYSQSHLPYDDPNSVLQSKSTYVPDLPKMATVDDVFINSNDPCFQRTSDRDLTCNNAIITAADTSSLVIAPSFKDNTIPVLAINNPTDNGNSDFNSFGDQNPSQNNQYFPVVFAPVPADNLSFLENTSAIVKESTPGVQDCINFLEDNELLQSCSVSSTSDIECKNSQASSVLGIPLNGEEDILSMIVKSCDIGEEFDGNMNSMEENDSEEVTSAPVNSFIESSYIVPATDIAVSTQAVTMDPLNTNSENAVSSSSEKQNSEILVIKTEAVEVSDESVIYELSDKSNLSDKNCKSTDCSEKDDTAFLDSMIHSFYGDDSMYGVPLSASCDNFSLLCPSFNSSILTQNAEKSPSECTVPNDKPDIKTENIVQSHPAKHYPILSEILSKTNSEKETLLFKNITHDNKGPLEIPCSVIATPVSQKMTSYRYCFIPAINHPSKEEIDISSVKFGAPETVESLSFDNSLQSSNHSSDNSSPQVFSKSCSDKDKFSDTKGSFLSLKTTSNLDNKTSSNISSLHTDPFNKLSIHSHLISTPCTNNIKKSFPLTDAIVSPINKETELTTDTMKRKRKLVYEDDLRGPSKLIKQEADKMVYHKFREKNSFEHSVDSLANYSCSDIEGPTLEDSRGFKVASENYGNARVRHEVQHLTVMSLEIHVSTRKDLRPDPKFDSVTAIFYCIYNDTGIKEEEEVVGMIVVDPSPPSSGLDQSDTLRNFLLLCPGVKNGFLFCVENEILLFEKLIKIIREWDPDILVGYEIQMSSWGYMIERADVLNINFRLLISRMIERADMKFLQVETDPTVADQTADVSRLNITGRIVLCVWRLMRKEITLNVYTFENVYYHVLHKRTPLYSFHDLTKWFLDLQKEKVIRYYVTRVQGSIKLLEKLDVIGRTSELARLFGIQFYEVLSRGSQYRVESMMLRTAAPMSYIPVSPSVRQRSHSRAPECVPLILEPESRFYIDPVVVLDFQSLYPSMIIAYNYCFSTCLGRVEHFGKNVPFEFGCTSLSVPVTLLQKLENDIHVSPTGIAFVKSSIRRGILPLMLQEILSTRIMVKQSMKKVANNGALKKLLDARQMGLKLIANVTYGYTGASFSGRMPSVEVADSIVGKGRETLERAIHMIENTSKWRAKVVYGDTDSLFILLPGRSKKQAFEIGQEIADAVTADNPKPVKLKFEKVYLPCVLQTKKRYVGFMYETLDQEKPVFDAKGIETVRRDSCPATAKVKPTSCSACNQPDTYENIIDNYCRADFVIRTKIRKLQKSKLACKRARILKLKDGVNRRDVRRPTLQHANMTSCCGELAKHAGKKARLLIMGNRDGSALTPTFIMEWQNTVAFRGALKAMKRIDCSNPQIIETVEGTSSSMSNNADDTERRRRSKKNKKKKKHHKTSGTLAVVSGGAPSFRAS